MPISPKQARPKWYKPYDQQRPSAQARGYDANWAKFSVIYKRKHPVCACGRPTVVPHHIVPLVDGGDRYDEGNLEPRCIDCHAMIHKNIRKTNG